MDRSSEPCGSVSVGDSERSAKGRYKGRVPTARRQASEIIRLKAEGVRPSEICPPAGYWQGQRISGVGVAQHDGAEVA